MNRVSIAQARERMWVLGATALAAFSLAFSACGNQGSKHSAAMEGCEETYTIGFSHPVGESQFVKALKNVVAEYGPSQCTEVLLDSTTRNNLETQRATIESWVTQQVDAIVFWPVDPSAYTNLVAQGREAGIKWLTYVSPVENQDGSVGFNAEQEGRGISEDVTAWIDEHYPDRDIEAAITKLSTQPTIKGRWEIPSATLKTLGIPIVSEQDCANQACGLEIAGQVLREHPDVRVFINFTDDVALGTQKAIANAGLDPDDYYVSGYDGSPEGLQNVKEGEGAFRVTMAIPVEELGHDVIDNSLAAISGEGDSNSLAPSIRVRPEDDAKIDELLAVFEGL